MIFKSSRLVSSVRNFSAKHPIVSPFTDESVKKIGLHDEVTFNILVIVTVIYVTILIIGLIGNITTCIVVSTNRSMRTTTNCYLLNLAISDLLLLITNIPYKIYINWYPNKYFLGQYGCFLQSLICEMSNNVSILTITAFTIERYLAICYPLVTITISKLSRAVRLIIALWITSILCAILVALQMKFSTTDNKSECVFNDNLVPYSLEIMTLIFFIFPMILITILYIRMGWTLVKSSRMTIQDFEENDENDETKCFYDIDSSTKRVLKMLVIIILTFFLCWAPFYIERLRFVHTIKVIYSIHDDKMVNFVIFYISDVFHFLSAVINPIIYNISSKKFREAFKDTIFKFCEITCFFLNEENLTSTNIKNIDALNVANTVV